MRSVEGISAVHGGEEVNNWKPETCAAITACASWLEAQGVGAGVAAARWLREEADHA
jgi:hypothetical protein